MSDQELSGSADNPTTETEPNQTQPNQRGKGPSKIPGTAVFRSPYSQGKSTTPYYIISSTPTNTSNLQQTNVSDEDKRRIMHNEVERRRKEKINKWIVRLCAIVPNCNSGKQSKNCVLEKTVNFLQQLMKERDLPENVQALRAEVLSLTEKVESLSTENAMYLSLLKEAQSLSGGAWTLNMSIQTNKPEITSSSDDSSTTMTPTLDRVETPNVRIAPNIPATSTTSSHPVFATVPIIHRQPVPLLTSGSLTGQTIQSIQPLLATGQVVQPTQPTLISKLHPNQQVPPSHTTVTHSVSIPVIQPNSVGSMVTAMPATHVGQQRPMANGTNMMGNGTNMMGNGTNMMGSSQTMLASSQTMLANGQTFVTNGTPVQPVMQVPQHVSSTRGSKSSHSIQALLSTATTGGAGVTAGNKTVYTIPAYLQPMSNGAGGHANIYIPAAQNTPGPVLVQGEQGHVVIMTPGTNPYFAIPLNTMSSSHVMCEPTASFKSPIVWNQFPATNQMEQTVPVKSGSNVLPQPLMGQQAVIQLPTVVPMVNQTVPQIVTPVGAGMAPVGMVGTHRGAQMTQTVPSMVLNQQLVQQMVQPQQQMVQPQQQMVQPQQQMVQPQQLLNQNLLNSSNISVNNTGQVLSGNQEHTIIQVPNSEVLMPQSHDSNQPITALIPQSHDSNQPITALIPQSHDSNQPITALIPQSQTQCYHNVNTGYIQTQVQQNPVIATVAPVTSINKVTDFSIGTFHGVVRSGHPVRGEDLSARGEDMSARGDNEDLPDDEDPFREYLRTSDASFSSDCFTPPYTSPNILLSSAGRDSISPGIEEPENKPLSHSIASLTGMN